MNTILKRAYTNEWYTPAWLLALVVEALGAIDLDPCSNAASPPNVPAALHYTAAEDGLQQPWAGRVFLNPPWSGGGLNRWVNHAVDEYEAGRVTEVILLVRAVGTETRWWQRLLAHPVCFLNRRVIYIPGAGENNQSPTQGSALSYLGPDLHRFAAVFRPHGRVMVPLPLSWPLPLSTSVGDDSCL